MDQEENFLDAKMSCESRGGSLAIIDTKAGWDKLLWAIAAQKTNKLKIVSNSHQQPKSHRQGT